MNGVRGGDEDEAQGEIVRKAGKGGQGRAARGRREMKGVRVRRIGSGNGRAWVGRRGAVRMVLYAIARERVRVRVARACGQNSPWKSKQVSVRLRKQWWHAPEKERATERVPREIDSVMKEIDSRVQVIDKNKRKEQPVEQRVKTALFKSKRVNKNIPELDVVLVEEKKAPFGAKIEVLDVHGLRVAPPPGDFQSMDYYGKSRESRRLRVWLPPNFDNESQEKRALKDYPLLILNDGQNLFEECRHLSFSGQSWSIAQTAGALCHLGLISPIVIVGVDHAAQLRSFDYNPVKPGCGKDSFRLEAKDWPGGGAEAFCDAIVHQLLPMMQSRYCTSSNPSKRFFGGSSFGGICALVMGTRHTDVFGGLLVESPSLWIDEGEYLEQELRKCERWPERMYLAMGKTEYDGRKGNDCEHLLVQYTKDLSSSLYNCGGMDESRLLVVLEENGIHNEEAWGRRLPTAMQWLLNPECSALKTLAAETKGSAVTIPPILQPGEVAAIFIDSKSIPLENTSELKIVYGFNNWTSSNGETRLVNVGIKGLPLWYMALITVPSEALEMNYALTDSNGNWDNNCSKNYKIGVRESAEALASKYQTSLFFSMPEVLLPGETAKVYLNRHTSQHLSKMPPQKEIKIHAGFNNWEIGIIEGTMIPRSLPAPGEWLVSKDIVVPMNAFEMNLAFSDGGDIWDNNDSNDFTLLVKKLQGKSKRLPRRAKSVESHDHAGGRLDIIKLESRPGVSAKARWSEEKILRVWLPQDYDSDNPPEGGYRVLYMNDGQNLFEDWLAHQGVSWSMGKCAAHLIGSNQLPPFIVVGIDGPVPFRSLNYCPYPPGGGQGGFRNDALRWPGGGVASYMERVIDEIMPFITDRYSGSTRPERLAFGGASFGGVCALYAALHYPNAFSKFLVESPSLWISEGEFLNDMRKHSGEWPKRLFLGTGTCEYSATRDHEDHNLDHLLLRYVQEAHTILSQSVEGHNLKIQTQGGAGHHEGAWAHRLNDSLRWLLEPWWQDT